MYLSIYRQYQADCKRFGWVSSLEGAKEYQRQVRAGYRGLWATIRKEEAK